MSEPSPSPAATEVDPVSAGAGAVVLHAPASTPETERPPPFTFQLIDFLCGGPKRAAFFGFSILAGEWFGVIAAVVGYVLIVNGYDAKSSTVIGSGLIFLVFTALSRTMKFYKDARDKDLAQRKQSTDQKEIGALKGTLSDTERRLQESTLGIIAAAERGYNEGATDGADDKMKVWSEVARHHEDGMMNVVRQLNGYIQPPARAPVTTEAMTSFLWAILEAFRGFYPSTPEVPFDLTATLAVVAQDRKVVHLVKIEPGGRGRSNRVPRPCIIDGLSWGMGNVINLDRDIEYTPDVGAVGAATDHGYLAVANLAVRDTNNQIIAVVNVDSPQVGIFGSLEQLQEARRYCLPILSSIALALADPRLFKDERA